MLYNIGQKLRCKKSINAQCLNMENPDVEILVGEIFKITDKDEYPEENDCHWYWLDSETGRISAWNDEPDHMIIDDCFEIINCQ